MGCTQVPRRFRAPIRLQTAGARHPGDSPVATRYYPRAPLVLRVVSFTRERRRSFHPPAPAQDRCRSYSPIRACSGDLNPPAHAERLDLRHRAAQTVVQRTRAHGRLYPSESRPTRRARARDALSAIPHLFLRNDDDQPTSCRATPIGADVCSWLPIPLDGSRSASET